MLNPNPGVFWPKLGLVLFAIHVADPLGLLQGAFGPFLGGCAPEIAKTATISVKLCFPYNCTANFWSVPPLGPIESIKHEIGCAVVGHAQTHESLPCDTGLIQCAHTLTMHAAVPRTLPSAHRCSHVGERTHASVHMRRYKHACYAHVETETPCTCTHARTCAHTPSSCR